MKLLEIFRFEITYQARRLSTWLFFVVLLVFSFLVNNYRVPSADIDAVMDKALALMAGRTLGGR